MFSTRPLVRIYLESWAKFVILTFLTTYLVYLDVDTAYASPYYGNIIGYQEALKPRAQTLQFVDFVYEVNGDKLKTDIKRALQYPKSCGDLA